MAEEDKINYTDIRKLLKDAGDADSETQYIPSGNIGFDLALTNGKGIPVGASVLLWASPGCGKTTLLADVCKRLLTTQKALNNKFRILYLAVEGSKELMKSLGLQEFMISKDFHYVEASLCWRQVGMIFDDVIANKDPVKDVKVIVIDSLNNILSDANKSKSVADGDFGSRAKERTMFLAKYLPVCKEKGINVFCIAQERHNQDAGACAYAPKTKAAATEGDRHNVDIVLKCSKVASRTDGATVKVNTIFGQMSKAKKYIMKMSSIPADCKNRYVGDIESQVLVVPGKGIDNNYVIRCLLEANKFLKANGGQYSFHKDLAETFNLPTSKMKRNDVMNEIETHKQELIKFLKEMDCYRVDIGETVVEEQEGEEQEGEE